MSTRWTKAERADANTEHLNNQPYTIIAEFLNKKYHQNQPIRTANSVRTDLGRRSASREPPSEDNIPEVVAQIVAEEMDAVKGVSNAIPDNLNKLLKNKPDEPKKIEDQSETEISDDEIDEFIETTATLQPLYQRASGVVRCPKIVVPETGWFGMVFSSDWHIGNIWTQLLTILWEAKIIAATPGLYMFFGGDSVDGGVPAGPHGGILNEQIMPASWQRACAKRIVRLISHKLLAAASGCHEWWSMDAADYDFIKEAAEESGCVYMGGGTKFTLKANGGGEWNGCYHHKAQGHSQYNVFHPNVRRALYHEQSSDIICVAHNHLSGTTRQVIGERLRYMARPGARKNFDRFASKLGSDAARDDLDVPVLLLHGTHGRNVKGQWIEGIPMAATVLTYLRQADPYARLSA